MARRINIKCNYEQPKRAWQSLILAGILFFGLSLPAAASYLPFNTSVNMNVGIGTSTPQGAFVVTNGNVGIGTWVPSHLFQVGKYKANSSGFEVDSNGNVGIGTTITSGGSLSVMNGNVGIGTWLPAAGLDAESSAANGFAVYGNSSTAGGVGVAGNDSSSGTGVFGTSNTGIAVLAQSSSATLYGLEVQNFGGGATAFFQSGSSAAGTLPTLIVEQFSTSTADLFQAQNASGISLVNITSVGNVGIGTFMPNGKLIVTGGNVGIGSLAPGQVLDVQGTARVTGFTLTGNGAGNGNVLVGNSIGVGTWMAASTLGVSGGSGTNYWLNDSTGNVGISTIYAVGIGTTFVGGTGEAAFSVMNGNVGIGTWLPSSALQVNGSASISNSLSVGGAGSQFVANSSGYISTLQGQAVVIDDSAVLVNNNGTATYGNNDNNSANNTTYQGGGNANSFVTIQPSAVTGNGDYIDFKEGNLGVGTVDVMRMANGNVGIGSTAPGTALDVNGTVRMTGLTLNQNPGAGYVLVGNGVGVGTWMAAGTLTTSGGSSSNYWLNDTGNVGISTAYAVGIGTISQINTLNIVGNIGIGTFSYDPYMRTAAPGGGMIISGNVGIGTWVPASNLDISSVGSGNVAVTIRSPGNQAELFLNSFSNYHWEFMDGVTGNLSIIESGVQNQQYINLVPGLTNGSTTPLNIIANGNVGIGSYNPVAALDVNGTVRMTGLTLSQNPGSGYVLVGNGVGVGTWMPAGTLATSGGSSQWITTNVNDVYLPNNGNVGIGTTLTSQAALTIMNGNVGVGTFIPQYTFVVGAGLHPIFHADIQSGGTIANLFEADNTKAGRFASTQGQEWYFEPYDVNGNSIIGSEGSIYLEGGSSGSTQYVTMTNAGNLGIGTITPVASLGIVGNVGIGTGMNSSYLTTSPPLGGMIVQGNVGIGSLTPGTALDVNGTVRITGLTLSQNPGAGYVLVGNGVGVGTWMPAGTLAPPAGSNYWLNTAAAGNVGISTTNTVGIGTTSGVGAGLVIMNGNVGIGTWKPAAALDVETGGNTYFGGNVGIGSSAPGETLDIQGVLRTTNFNLSTNPTSGFVLTADAFGNGTWQSLSDNDGWTVSGNNVYETSSGNVGIGTTTVNQGALVVTNGNVGIGTWAPLAPLQVVGVGTQAPNGGGLIVTNGNVGIGTVNPTSPLFVNGGIITSYNALEATGEGIVTYVGNGKAIAMQAGTANGNILYDNTGGFSFQSEARGSVLQGTSSSSNITMIIDTNGNVGIGTTGSVLGGLIVQNGAVGIGTNLPQTALVVMGNQGIGTWTAKGGNLIVNGGGNVGIGSAWPGTMLDVQGTLRGIGEIINGNIGIGTSALQTAFAVAYGNVGIGTWTASSGLQLKESFALYRVGTGASVQSAGQTIIGVTSTGATRTITLATADVVLGRVIIIKDESGGAGTNNITINTQGGQTIDGAATVTISANYGVLRVYSDGNNWFTF